MNLLNLLLNNLAIFSSFFFIIINIEIYTRFFKFHAFTLPEFVFPSTAIDSCSHFSLPFESVTNSFDPLSFCPLAKAHETSRPRRTVSFYRWSNRIYPSIKTLTYETFRAIYLADVSNVPRYLLPRRHSEGFAFICPDAGRLKRFALSGTSWTSFRSFTAKTGERNPWKYRLQIV